MMKTYRQCYLEPRKLHSDKWDHYFEIYDQHFDRHRRAAQLTYLEIGCQSGGSLEVARKYFGEHAKIYGIDIDPACAALNSQPFVNHVFIGSQSDIRFLGFAFQQIGTPHVIVDDGSHQQSDMITSFLWWFPKLADGGTYLIEDVHSVYMHTHQELFHGLDVYDFFNGLTQKLSIDYIGWGDFLDSRYRVALGERPKAIRVKQGIIGEIRSICFYNSIIVIEKGIQPEPFRHGV